MASELPLIKLIMLGFELCGTYSLSGFAGTNNTYVYKNSGVDGNRDAAGTEGATGAAAIAASATLTTSALSGFYSRPQLTSVSKLSAFVDRMEGADGVKNARKALNYIADGSASPMETILVMLMILPYRLGGYGLPVPELNSRITPVKEIRSNSSKSFYSCDLLWRDANLAVEYDSNQYHTGAERIASDSKRRNVLNAIGITVYTVTSKQIYSYKELEKVAKLLAIRLGKRLRYENTMFMLKQSNLRSILFSVTG